MKKLHKIMFVVLLGNFLFCPFLEARYKWRWDYNNFPIHFHIPIDLKNETLLQKAFRGALLMCMGGLAMEVGYEGIKVPHERRNQLPIFLRAAIFCGGGFLCAHAITIFKNVYEKLGEKELI